MSESWTDRVREKLAKRLENDDAETLRQISISLGIPYATIYDFAKKGGGLSSTNLEKLAESLGFRMVLQTKKKLSEIR